MDFAAYWGSLSRATSYSYLSDGDQEETRNTSLSKQTYTPSMGSYTSGESSVCLKNMLKCISKLFLGVVTVVCSTATSMVIVRLIDNFYVCFFILIISTRVFCVLMNDL